MSKIVKSVCLALIKCRIYVLTIFITYCISSFAGIIMVQNGNSFAISYRDKIVGKALTTDSASINYQKGKYFSAALRDFSGNLLYGAIPQTLLGFGIVIPYFTVSKQGWIAGIVSINSEHKSRFKNFKSTFYYFFVLLLQFIPYSLAIGSGIKFGVDFYNNNKIHGWLIRNFRIPKQDIFDIGYLYLLVVPLFFLASCFEFMSTWNV